MVPDLLTAFNSVCAQPHQDNSLICFCICCQAVLAMLAFEVRPGRVCARCWMHTVRWRCRRQVRLLARSHCPEVVKRQMAFIDGLPAEPIAMLYRLSPTEKCLQATAAFSARLWSACKHWEVSLCP